MKGCVCLENGSTLDDKKSGIQTAKDTAKGTKKLVKGTKKVIRIIKWVASLSTVLTVGGLFLLLIILLSAAGGSTKSNSELPYGSAINLSPTTLQWQDLVEEEANAQGVPELIPYLMAMIEVESKGVGGDVMQSSESAGYPPNTFTNPKDSIAQGVKYLAAALAIGKNLGFTDLSAVVQSYNFGTSYVSYLATKGQKHSVDVAEEYSRKIVAPSLGNSNGSTYSYVNAVSQASGKTYLYKNGGNFHYADLVKQYLTGAGANTPVGSAEFEEIIKIASQFEGNPYVWGGADPSVGFDCSGLIQWVYGQAGITLPRIAADQYTATTPVSFEDAQAGDLIFFKGTYGAPDYISHVGIYIDETTMFAANGSGIGYHYHTSSYWASHYASIHRIGK